MIDLDALVYYLIAIYFVLHSLAEVAFKDSVWAPTQLHVRPSASTEPKEETAYLTLMAPHQSRPQKRSKDPTLSNVLSPRAFNLNEFKQYKHSYWIHLDATISESCAEPSLLQRQWSKISWSNRKSHRVGRKRVNLLRDEMFKVISLELALHIFLQIWKSYW